nr:IQ domain-containing protein K isoform X4 [Taeniopygia guttata]
MNVKLIQNCSQSSILIAEPLRFSQSLRTLRLHRWETSTALLQRGYLPSALTSAQSRRFAFKCPFSALQGVLEHEAEQPQVSDVPQSKQDPESKQESVSAVQVPLEAAIPMEQLFSAPAAQYLLPILGEAPPGEPPDPKKCSPREYLEFYIFPVVLPGLAALLHETEKEKCFETVFVPRGRFSWKIKSFPGYPVGLPCSPALNFTLVIPQLRACPVFSPGQSVPHTMFLFTSTSPVADPQIMTYPMN